MTRPDGSLAAVRARVRAAAERAGRADDEIALVGVAKGIAAERVAEAVREGLAHVGESYVQEALARRVEVRALLADSGCAEPRWHFIGRIQTNKARPVAAHFDVVHTLDRPALGAALERHAAEAGRTLEALIQVNTSGEPQKGGATPDEVAELVAASAAWPHLRVVGLMAIPAPAARPDDARPEFATLRALRDALHEGHPELTELSMGMSGDYEVAIEEGATIIRVGTALFGPRRRRQS